MLNRLVVLALGLGQGAVAFAAPSLVFEEARPTPLGWSPKGDRLAVAGSKLTLVGEEENTVVAARAVSGPPAWDKSGKKLIYVVQSPQGLWDLLWLDSVANERRVLRSGEGVSDLHWIPKQQAIVAIDASQGDARLVRVDVNTGETTQPCGTVGVDAGPKVSPNGKWVAFLRTADDRGARVQVCELASGEVTDRGSAGSDTFDRAVAWSADSAKILVLRDRPRAPRYTTIDVSSGAWEDNGFCVARITDQLAWNRYGDILALDPSNRTLYACTAEGVSKTVVGSAEAFSVHPKDRTVAAWVRGSATADIYRQSAPSQLQTSTVAPVYNKSGVYLVDVDEGVKLKPKK